LFERGAARDAKTIRAGQQGIQAATHIGGIFGRTIIEGSSIVITSSGQLGTTTSSARFKDNISAMDKSSEAILSLKPVTFRYKKEIDPKGVQQFGPPAEQVEEINPALVVHDEEGNPYSVRDDAINSMLLNEFLKEHNAFVEAQHKIDRLETTVASLVTTLKEQAAQIQKVSVQVELSKAALQTVLNDQ
jgi:hypothetical protein